MADFDCDVAIIGAGFAGAAAACELAHGGHRAIIIEANGRVGGRAFTRPMALGGEALEFGGAWITPLHKRIRHHARLAAMDLRPRHAVTGRRHLLGAGDPKLLARVTKDAMQWASGGGVNSALTLARYMDDIGADAPERSQIMAWWTISGSGDPARVSVSELFSSLAYEDGRLDVMIEKLQHSIKGGAGLLVERMIAHSGAKLMLGAKAARGQQ
jgi:monoamine oxidase